jgi:hypothetical protein
MTNSHEAAPFLLRFASQIPREPGKGAREPLAPKGSEQPTSVSETSKTAVPRETTDDD